MPKLAPGAQMPDITCVTPFGSEPLSAKTARAQKTVLLFLRYYGCTLCQYEMAQLSRQYKLLAAKNAQALVVLRSAPETLAAQLQPGSLPFEVVCDPDGGLYRRFAIAPARSKAQLADLKTLGLMAKATAAGFKHGAYEGEELQLPAAFILTPDRTVVWAHYGRAAGDTPTPAQLAALL